MGKNFSEYSETTDLYLQILREAQRIEDKRLIHLIQRRLRQLGKTAAGCTDGGCKVILFPQPCHFTPQALLSTENMPRFWPKSTFLQLGIYIAAYLLLISAHTFWS